MAAIAQQTRLPRSQSSVLAFALRDFLNTPTQYVPVAQHNPALQAQLERSQAARTPAATQQSYAHAPRSSPPEDAVWVDCFYYGFWLEKDKAASYQRSVQQHPAHQHQQREPWM